MKKYGLVLIGAALLVLVAATAFPAGEPDVDSNEPTTVAFLMGRGNDAQAQAMTTMVDQFNATAGMTAGIIVDYQPVPGGWQEYTQKVLAQVAANEAPDIINLSPLNKVDFTSNGFLMDLKPLMDDYGFNTDLIFQSNLDSWAGAGGEYFGVGHGALSEAVFFNKDLFEAAGLEIPSLEWGESWTWEEFADYARALTTGSGATKQYGFFVEPQLGWMTPIFRAYGGSVGKLDGSSLNMNHPGSVEALEFLVELMWEDETCPPPAVTAATPGGDLFKAGRLAMHWEGAWWMGGYLGADLPFEWGVLPVPSGPEGTFTGMWVDAYCIPVKAPNPETAIEVIEYFIGAEASNIYLNEGIFGIPANKEVAAARGMELYPDFPREYSTVWIESAAYGVQPEYTLNWNEVWDMTNTYIERIELGELSAQEAADLMVEESIRLIEAVR